MPTPVLQELAAANPQQVASEVAHELGGALSADQVVQIGWSTAVGIVSLVLERELAPALSPGAVQAMIDTVMTSMRTGLRGAEPRNIARVRVSSDR